MNLAVSCITDGDLAAYEQSQGEGSYTTMPLIENTPPLSPVQEELEFTLFEAAIRDRVIVERQHVSHVSEPRRQTPPPCPVKTTSCVTQTFRAISVITLLHLHRPRLGQKWQRSLLSGCIALLLMLLGFDTMGILVLYVR